MEISNSALICFLYSWEISLHTPGKCFAFARNLTRGWGKIFQVSLTSTKQRSVVDQKGVDSKLFTERFGVAYIRQRSIFASAGLEIGWVRKPGPAEFSTFWVLVVGKTYFGAFEFSLPVDAQLRMVFMSYFALCLTKACIRSYWAWKHEKYYKIGLYWNVLLKTVCWAYIGVLGAFHHMGEAEKINMHFPQHVNTKI